MTCAADRFLLDNRAAEDGVDASRDLDWAGVRSSMMFTDIGSCFTVETPGSLISIRSSSSSLAGVCPPRFTVSASVGAAHTPSASTTTESTSRDVDPRISSTYLNGHSQLTSYGSTGTYFIQTYWSTCNDSKLVDLEHTGQVQVGACFCSSRKDAASKHWLCVHTTERQGTWILSVDSGHLSDMILDVATISVSSARFFTITDMCQKAESRVQRR
jgi:hypothetical protein